MEISSLSRECLAVELPGQPEGPRRLVPEGVLRCKAGQGGGAK